MINFIRNMTFPRGVILVSLLASAVLGILVFQKSFQLRKIEEDLKRVPDLVAEIQKFGIEYTNLQQIASGEIIRGEQLDFETYIRSQAADPMVEIGQVRTSPSVKTYARDVEDRIFKIQPNNRNQRYQRSRIGNFLYKLEADSRRVKVTSLKITPFGKIKPGEVGDDFWTFEAAITVRTKVEPAAQG